MELPPAQSTQCSPLLNLCKTGIREPFTEHLTPEAIAALRGSCAELHRDIQVQKLETHVFAHNLLADIEGLDFSKMTEKVRAFKNVFDYLRFEQLQQCPSSLDFKPVTSQPRKLLQEATTLAPTDPQKAIELYREARAIQASEIVDYYLPDFLAALAQVDSNKVHQIALEDEIDIDILSKFAEKVAPSLPEIALQIAKIQTDDFKRCKILEPVVATLALTDLDRALELANTFPKDTFYKNKLLTSIAISIAPTNFSKALEILDGCFPIDPENCIRQYVYAADQIQALVEIGPKLNSNDEQEIIFQRFHNFAEQILLHRKETTYDVRKLATMAESLARMGKHDLATDFLQDALTLAKDDEWNLIHGAFRDIVEALPFLENTPQRSALFADLVQSLIARIQNPDCGRNVMEMLIPHLFKLDPETAENLFETQILGYFNALMDINNKMGILDTAFRHLPVQSPSAAARILRKILVTVEATVPEHANELFMLIKLDSVPQQLFSSREFVWKLIRSEEFKAIPEGCKLQFLLKALAAMPEKFPDIQNQLFKLVNQHAS